MVHLRIPMQFSCNYVQFSFGAVFVHDLYGAVCYAWLFINFLAEQPFIFYFTVISSFLIFDFPNLVLGFPVIA